jgi:hypothetical protein
MIERELLAHGYLYVVLGTLVEADATMLAAAFLARRGYFQMSLVIMTAVLVSSAVSHAVYYLARIRGVAAFERKAATNPRWRKLQQAVQKRGPWLLLGSRLHFRIEVHHHWSSAPLRGFVRRCSLFWTFPARWFGRWCLD